MIKENWNDRAMLFLDSHGWERHCDNLLGHESFPMLEDISGKNGALNFVERFYTKAWGAHRTLIEGTNILVEERQEELKENALVLLDETEEGQ